jgi:tetrathionate reductase subunit B
MEVDVKMDNDNQDRDETEKSSHFARRDFLKKALKVGGAASMVALAGGPLGVAKALAATATSPAADGAAANWEGWEDPALNVNDGWNNYDYILNPNNLPIYHDNFDRIDQSHPKHHWVMVIDLRKCVGCQSCTVACKSENNIPVGYYRTYVDVSQEGSTTPTLLGETVTANGNFEQLVKVLNVPKLCNHCDNPPCVTVCPVKATFKRQDGPVLVDPRLCIGCGTCVNACPYDARFINPISNTADKCTFCVERIDQGVLPACVTTCVGRARIFGDLNDPMSEVSQLVGKNQVQVRKPEMGTDPQVFYIGLDGTIATDDNPEIQHLLYTYTMNTNSSTYQKLSGGSDA